MDELHVSDVPAMPDKEYWAPFPMPCGVEAAAGRLAKAVERDGYENAIVQVMHGQISTISLFDEDGTQHFVQLRKGNWHEYTRPVGEGAAK